jgi:uncharacterized protein YybS (DUF2232 family)
MSPWAADAPNSDVSGGSAQGGVPGGDSRLGAGPSGASRVPRWTRALPFFLSALLFLSGFFSVFAPAPLLVLAFGQGLPWALGALMTNTLVVYFLAGTTSLAFYVVYVASAVLALALGLRRRVSVERLLLGAMAVMGLTALVWLGVQGLLREQAVLQELGHRAQQLADYVLGSLSSDAREGWLAGQTPEEWRRAFIAELPSVALVSSLVMLLANLLVLLRINPGAVRDRLGLAPDWHRHWKTPEWLLFPAIAVGAGMVLDQYGLLSAQWQADITLNVFKVFMAVYALQGLSVLSFVFEAWRIRGLLRTAGYLIAVLLMMPLVLSLGFFDQWFDFRAKLRQS